MTENELASAIVAGNVHKMTHAEDLGNEGSAPNLSPTMARSIRSRNLYRLINAGEESLPRNVARWAVAGTKTKALLLIGYIED